MEKYYFFDSNTAIGDRRLYSAADWSKVLSKFLENGIYVEGDNLSVTADGTAMAVTVGTGVAFIDGHMYENDAPLTLNVDAAEATLDRIDLVVLRLDFTEQNRYIRTFVVKGEAAAAPVAPIPADTTFIKEIPLAEIRVTAGKSIVDQTQITDRRPEDFVDPFVDGSRITNLENVLVPQAEANAIKWAKSFGLGYTGKTVSDLDLANDGGFYYYNTNSTNAPTTEAGILFVSRGNNFGQIAITTSNKVYTRSKSSTWSAWSQIETTAGAQAKADQAESNAKTASVSKSTDSIVTASIQEQGLLLGNSVDPATDLAGIAHQTHYRAIISNKTGYPQTYGSVFGFKNANSYHAYCWQFFRGSSGDMYYRSAGAGTATTTVWGPWGRMAIAQTSFVEANRGAAPQSIANNTATKLVFETEVIDKDGEFDLTNNRFTAKASGLYAIRFLGGMDSVIPSIYAYVNGVNKGAIVLQDSASSSAINRGFSGNLYIELTAGQYLEFYAYQSSGAAQAFVEFFTQIVKIR